jgi:hypothetical protein
MKLYLILLTFLFCASVGSAQDKSLVKKPAAKVYTNQVVEASCGECQFKLKGQSCDLAVKIDGKAYFVDGSDIDEHGDAHAKDGFCEKVRKAVVSGQVVNNRFKASSFKLLPEDKVPAANTVKF